MKSTLTGIITLCLFFVACNDSQKSNNNKMSNPTNEPTLAMSCDSIWEYIEFNGQVVTVVNHWQDSVETLEFAFEDTAGIRWYINQVYNYPVKGQPAQQGGIKITNSVDSQQLKFKNGAIVRVPAPIVDFITHHPSDFPFKKVQERFSDNSVDLAMTDELIRQIHVVVGERNYLVRMFASDPSHIVVYVGDVRQEVCFDSLGHVVPFRDQPVAALSPVTIAQARVAFYRTLRE